MRHRLSIATLAALAAVVSLASVAQAQITVTLRDGSSVRATTLAAQGTRLSLTPEAGGAPRVVEAATVERVDMLQPQILTDAYTAFASGETVKTLQAMGRLRTELGLLKKIPGGREWWLEGEFLRAHILLTQKRVKDVDQAMREIAADSTDPVAQRHAQVFLAHLTGLAGDPRQALEQLRSLILGARDQDTLADAWLFTGQHLATVNEQQTALVAFLRIPVFYPSRLVPLASARLGAARCFVAIEDLAAARQTLKELLATQATTLAGVEGQKLLSQVERDLGLTPNATDASQ